MRLRESNSTGTETAVARAEARGDGLHAIKSLVLDAVTSHKTKEAYGKAIDEFLRWYASEQPGALTKAVVQRFRAALETRGLAASSINIRLAAIRKLGRRPPITAYLSPRSQRASPV